MCIKQKPKSSRSALFERNYGKDAEVPTTFIYPLLDEEFHTVKEIPDDVCEEIAQEFIKIVGKINNLEFDRPENARTQNSATTKPFAK